MKTWDYRGLACPQPVIETKKALEANSGMNRVHIIVDNKPAVENITRFLTNQGLIVDVVEGENSSYSITGTKDGTLPEPEINEGSGHNNKSTLILFTGNSIGNSNPDLGSKLMVNFIKTLSEIKDSLWRLVFVNEGVKMTAEGSDALDDIMALEKDGISVLVCGTCLEYYQLLDEKRVGETTNMLDIMTSLQVADKVINM